LNYARKLASDKDIPLEKVMHLDQSQKKEMHKKAPKSGSPSTFDQKIKPYFKQQSSYKKAKVACAALYNLIAKDGTITKQTMQEATGIKTTTLKTYLKYLTEASLIKRVGPDNGGHWEVTSGNNKH
jgi:predicted HTH transcriptional regulator